MSKLTLDELLALQLMGCDSKSIIRNDISLRNMLNTVNGKMAIDKAISILRRQKSLGIETIAFGERRFPQQLKAIGVDCPPLIYFLGNVELLSKKDVVAIIGARSATRMGNLAAYRLGAYFGKMKIVVLSGLALGCDTSAHEGCLAVNGDTIAVVATGLDLTHPKENVLLQKRILASGGLLISEQPLAVKANPRRLVSRNRLQAALSQEVIVAECSVQSGTMYTVRFAVEYGKTVRVYDLGRFGLEASGNEEIIKSGLGQPIKI